MLTTKIEGNNPAELLFTLSGELAGEGVDMLVSHWNRYQAVRKDRVCIVDVSKVTSIDGRGERAIRYLASEGARFRVSGPIVGNIIDLVCKEKRWELQNGQREFTSIVFCLRP